MSKKKMQEKINVGFEDEMVIAGFKKSKLHIFLLVFGIICTGGLLLLLLTWKSKFRLMATHKKSSLQEADKVFLEDVYTQQFVEDVYSTNIVHGDKVKNVRYFFNKNLKYVWEKDAQCFLRVSGLESGNKCSYFHDNKNGLSSSISKARQEFYGINSIEVEVKPVLHLLYDEVVNPFYIFQLYSVILWSVQLYYYFAIGVLILSAVSITFSVLETRKQSKLLHDAAYSHSLVTIIRDNQESLKSSFELVPGDVVILPNHDFVLECDCVLLSGNCIVNESMLTGESIPVSKLPLPNDSQVFYDIDKHKKNTLFCGTKILQVKSGESEKAKALVVRTGFSTTKGELIRSILFPKPLEIKFYSDFLRFFIIFIILGIIAVIYSGIMWTTNKATILEIVFNSLDVLTFVIPPILPAAYTSITAVSQKRLQKNGIYCLSSKYINLCGAVDVFCFDKTGTLTENTLDLAAVVPVYSATFHTPVLDPTHLPFSPLLCAMATAHGLTYVHDQLSGYPLDAKVFEATNWILKESSDNSIIDVNDCPATVVFPRFSDEVIEIRKIAIVKQFPFESSMQRMTVVTQFVKLNTFEVFTKGAPEKIKSLCKPESVPDEFEEVLLWYTRQGFRVLAVAGKLLTDDLQLEDIKLIERKDFEANLEFLGLIVMQNSLKPETNQILSILHAADIKTIMITGDNLLTAISIARECLMIKKHEEIILVEAFQIPSESKKEMEVEIKFKVMEKPEDPEDLNYNYPSEDFQTKLLSQKNYKFAMEGQTFQALKKGNPKMLEKIVHQSVIFARMLPDQKSQLIQILQNLGHQVGMCGDGANDCGALKVAHAGIALSVDEAAAVAAPFTSSKVSISCVPQLISEGRAALVSCIGVFKFQVAYCFTQLFMALMLFYVALEPSDLQYVCTDMILNIIPAVTFGNSEAYPGLVKVRPVQKLLEIIPLTSIFSYLMLQLIVYYVIWEYTLGQPWYEPTTFIPGLAIPFPSYEGTALFSMNIFSCLLAVIIFSPGPPYRKRLYTNKSLTLFLILGFIGCSFVMLHPGELTGILSLKRYPDIWYFVTLYGIAIGSCCFCYLWETYIVEGILALYILPKVRKLQKPIHQYQKLEREMEKDDFWNKLGYSNVSESETKISQAGKVEDEIQPLSVDEVECGIANRRTRVSPWQMEKHPVEETNCCLGITSSTNYSEMKEFSELEHESTV